MGFGNNTTCPTCGRKFHSCTNCGHMYDWEYRYCSLQCWKQSPEYDPSEDPTGLLPQYMPEHETA